MTSAVGFLVMLILAIVLLVFLIMKVNLHPTFSLFLTGLVFSLCLGFSFADSLSTLTGGFGDTMSSLGIPIMLGCAGHRSNKIHCKFLYSPVPRQESGTGSGINCLHCFHSRFRRYYHNFDIEHRKCSGKT